MKVCAVLLLSLIQVDSFLMRPQRSVSIASMLAASVDTDEAQRLKDQAAKLRAEIAALEGKSVAQVEKEAADAKKETAERMLQAEQRKQESASRQPKNNKGRMIEVPESPTDMVLQAARAVERAYKDGVTRQTVRFALVDVTDENKNQPFFDLPQWPGGAEQMSRRGAQPLTQELLETIRLGEDQAYQRPSIKKQDVWDFDGSALFTSEASEGAEGDIQALVLPNTDVKYVRDIAEIDAVMKDRLFLLVNPFWRNVESWGINLLAPGAKKKAQEVIFDRGYDETYVFLRFSARGEECVAIKAYPYDWQIFAYIEDPDLRYERAIRIGSTKEDPKSDVVTEMINQRPEFKLTRAMRQITR